MVHCTCVCINKLILIYILLYLQSVIKIQFLIFISISVMSTVDKIIYLASCLFKVSYSVSFSFTAFNNVLIVCSVSVLYFCRSVHLFRKASILQKWTEINLKLKLINYFIKPKRINYISMHQPSLWKYEPVKNILEPWNCNEKKMHLFL